MTLASQIKTTLTFNFEFTLLKKYVNIKSTHFGAQNPSQLYLHAQEGSSDLCKIDI